MQDGAAVVRDTTVLSYRGVWAWHAPGRLWQLSEAPWSLCVSSPGACGDGTMLGDSSSSWARRRFVARKGGCDAGSSFCSPSSSPSTSFCSTSSSPSTTFFADRFRWTCLASGTFSSWLHLWRASGRRDWASRHLCRGTNLGASGYLLFVAVLVEDSCGARVGSLLPVLWCKLAVFVYLLFRRVLVACASVARLGTGAALSLSAHPFSFFRCLPR